MWVSLLALLPLYLFSAAGYGFSTVFSSGCRGNAGLTPCFSGIEWLLGGVFIGWILSVWVTAKALQRAKIPRIPLVLILSEFTFICSVVLLGSIGFWLLPLIRPLLTTGYYAVFDVLLPALHEKT